MKQQFKAESQRLLDLMINSIYTHREIFLREIISNASDAIDKLAYTALTDDKVGISRDQFAITIIRDEANRDARFHRIRKHRFVPSNRSPCAEYPQTASAAAHNRVVRLRGGCAAHKIPPQFCRPAHRADTAPYCDNDRGYLL